MPHSLASAKFEVATFKLQIIGKHINYISNFFIFVSDKGIKNANLSTRQNDKTRLVLSF